MEEDQPIFQTSDLDDDIIYSSDSDDEPPQLQPEPLNHIIPDPYPSSSDPDDIVLPTAITTTTTTITTSSSVTVAISSAFTQPPFATVTTTAAAAAPRPIDDSRKLFQRLWTDEDEIELLQGFLDYTAIRGPTVSGHYHDTGPFYDKIKKKLQLDFSKNQLVEKLRRLKKKYRVNLSKINSGKDFVFKSPHDHATFEISKKIWSNVSENTNRAAISGVEFDFDDHNPNPSPNCVSIVAGTPPRPLNSSYVISHINLKTAGPGGGSDMMLPNWSGNGGGDGGGLPKLWTRKRSRVASNTGKAEEKFVKNEGGIGSGTGTGTGTGTGIGHIDNYSTNNDSNVVVNNAGVSPPLQGMVKETVRNCLSPMLKDLINNAVNGSSGITGVTGVGTVGGGSHGFNLNPVTLNVPGVNVEGGMDEKWRKQQILELEVYSKRLELVQEQIKLSLEELREIAVLKEPRKEGKGREVD